MKRSLIVLLAMLALSPVLMSAGKEKKKKLTKAEQAAYNDSVEIHWMSIEQAEAAMKKAPKKVWIDMYTAWCGWCKVMDRKTFTNPDVIRYMNANFYAVKMDAEQKDSITFQGRKYGFVPENRANMLAVQLMNGQMSYPTSLIAEENFTRLYAFPGYQTVPQTEKIVRYFNEGDYKTKTWQQHEAAFKPTWREHVVDGAPAAGH